jgi:hypothetical protein
MVKYRLTWQGTGALDLSQVADETGMPVLFTRPGDSVIITAGTFQHPFVQSYLSNGLQAERLGAVIEPASTPLKLAAPPSPELPPPLPPPPPPPEPLPVAPSAPPTEVAVPTPKPEAPIPEPEAPAVESTVDSAVPASEVSEEPTRGRGGRVPRGRAR